MLFVTVAARIVGIVRRDVAADVRDRARSRCSASASVFAAAGWTGPGARAAVLTVGDDRGGAPGRRPATSRRT
ncbi:MAG: hypothetical protein MZU79_00720 [Anaerotruncus sp.]|nr:hypothetical protein [Anaerotruncus sp.]